MSELTGRRRYRQDHQWGWIEVEDAPVLIVLQVEYTEFTNVEEGKVGRWVCMWRDATPEDVLSEMA